MKFIELWRKVKDHNNFIRTGYLRYLLLKEICKYTQKVPISLKVDVRTRFISRFPVMKDFARCAKIRKIVNEDTKFHLFRNIWEILICYFTKTFEKEDFIKEKKSEIIRLDFIVQLFTACGLFSILDRIQTKFATRNMLNFQKSLLVKSVRFYAENPASG